MVSTGRCEPAGDAARLDLGRPLLLPGAGVGPGGRRRALDRLRGGYRLGHLVVSRGEGAILFGFGAHPFSVPDLERAWACTWLETNKRKPWLAMLAVFERRRTLGLGMHGCRIVCGVGSGGSDETGLLVQSFNSTGIDVVGLDAYAISLRFAKGLPRIETFSAGSSVPPCLRLPVCGARSCCPRLADITSYIVGTES